MSPVLVPSVNRSCGENLTGPEGEITSPNYPNHYDNLMECRWLITVDQGYSIRLHIESSIECQKDSLTVWADSTAKRGVFFFRLNRHSSLITVHCVSIHTSLSFLPETILEFVF